jgi:hypothetical protein
MEQNNNKNPAAGGGGDPAAGGEAAVDVAPISTIPFEPIHPLLAFIVLFTRSDNEIAIPKLLRRPKNK